jgi:hypothetical protein
MWFYATERSGRPLIGVARIVFQSTVAVRDPARPADAGRPCRDNCLRRVALWIRVRAPAKLLTVGLELR